MAAERDAYRELQRHLDKMPVGYPATKSGVEMDLLKQIFTTQEARIATHLDYKHKTVDRIFETARGEVGSTEELTRILDEIVAKGGVTRRERNGRREYAVLPLLLWGMYEHQLKRLSPDFLMSLGQYLQGEMGYELATSGLPKMRVIPIGESIETEQRVATYEELRHLIGQAGDHIAIQECMCKKASDLQGQNCQATDRREVCMSLGDLAELYVEEGWGRRISQPEALEIARKNEEEGLVLMSGNEQEPTFVCACCGDCCGVLKMANMFPRPTDALASNYSVQIDEVLCTGSGECVQICPTAALKLEDSVAVVELVRCIGCGLCVSACPANAIRLAKKDEETIPPRTEEDFYDTIMAQKSSLTGRMRNTFLKTFLRIGSRFSG